MLALRATLALILAAPYFLLSFVAPVVGDQTYYFRVTMAAPAATMAQLFFDRGAGYREEDSSRMQVGKGLAGYELPIPVGALRALRFDPGLIDGRYLIRSVEIRRPDRRPYLSLALTPVATHELRLVDGEPGVLTLDSPAGSGDPSLVFPLPAGVELHPLPTSVARFLTGLLSCWAIALLAVLGVERASRALGNRARRARLWERASRSPSAAIAIAAAIATSLAMYPVLMAHRSLVAPGTTVIPLLYDHAPFVPGSTDFALEDARGSDVGATMWAFVPYSNVQRDALQHGEWPLWIRENGAGRPLWGQGQTFLLDPLHWLTLVTPDPALGWDLKFVAHRFVFASGIGAAAWLATGSLPGAMVAAACAPFAGLYVFRLNHPAAFAPSYAGWVLAGWFLLSRAHGRSQHLRAALLLVAASSLTLLASPPKEGVVMLAGSHLTGVLALVFVRRTARARLVGLATAAAAGVAGALLTTPHWLVFIDTLSKARTTYDAPAVHFATRDSAIGYVLGNLTPGPLEPGLHLLGVGLAIAALLSPAALRRSPCVGASAIGTIALVGTAYGLIPAEWLVRVPLVRNIGHLGNTLMTASIVPVLVLAAGGVEMLLQAHWTRRALSTAALASGAALLLAMTAGPGSLGHLEQWVLLFALGLTMSIPGVLGGVRRYPDNALPVVCATVLIGGLLLPFGLHLETGYVGLDRLLPQPRLRVPLDTNANVLDRARLIQETPVRAIGLGNVLFQGTQALYELEGIGGPDALALGAYDELLDAGGVARQWGWLTLVPPEALARMGPLLDMLNVAIVVTREGEMPAGIGRVEPDDDPWIDVGVRTTAWPRAYFVDGVRSAASAADVLALAGQAGHPIATLDPADAEAAAATTGLSSNEHRVVPATSYKLTTNLTRFRVRATAPGVAVLTESYMPGDFRATVNGSPVPYFRVNHAFKAVRIPAAGEWVVAFEYRPVWWTRSWILASGGAVLLLSAALALTRRDRE